MPIPPSVWPVVLITMRFLKITAILPTHMLTTRNPAQPCGHAVVLQTILLSFVQPVLTMLAQKKHRTNM